MINDRNVENFKRNATHLVDLKAASFVTGAMP